MSSTAARRSYGEPTRHPYPYPCAPATFVEYCELLNRCVLAPELHQPHHCDARALLGWLQRRKYCSEHREDARSGGGRAGQRVHLPGACRTLNSLPACCEEARHSSQAPLYIALALGGLPAGTIRQHPSLAARVAVRAVVVASAWADGFIISCDCHC